jgi:hypothetical protein
VLDRKKSLLDIREDREMSIAIYRFLSLSFQDFSRFWPLYKLLDQLDYKDSVIKYLGILSVSIAVGMSDREQQQMVGIHLSPGEISNAIDWYISLVYN